jgi:ADP-ribose pyrophosphatase YjhB (NUDIX family)
LWGLTTAAQSPLSTRAGPNPTAKYKRLDEPIRTMDKLAWYGPTDRYRPAPGGGMCISVFAIAEENHKVLVGIPKRNKRWGSGWVPAWASYSKEDYGDVFRQWRLPSGYLREGEHPDVCVRRVIRDQVGVEKFDLSPARVFSYSTPSDWYPGKRPLGHRLRVRRHAAPAHQQPAVVEAAPIHGKGRDGERAVRLERRLDEGPQARGCP